MTEVNRLQAAIDKYAARFATYTPAEMQVAEKMAMKVTPGDLATFQEVKSLAQASGLITLEEAMTTYDLLGGEVPTVPKWLSRPLAERMAVVALMGELMLGMRDKASQHKGRRRKR